MLMLIISEVEALIIQDPEAELITIEAPTITGEGYPPITTDVQEHQHTQEEHDPQITEIIQDPDL